MNDIYLSEIMTNLHPLDQYKIHFAKYDGNNPLDVYIGSFEEELEDFLKKDNKPMIKIIKSNAGSEPFDQWDKMNEKSILALYGYCVGKNGLPANKRETILGYLFDNKILQCHQIISHLQDCIRLRENRRDVDFSEAIDDWKHDISFIREYAKNSGKLKYITGSMSSTSHFENDELPFS